MKLADLADPRELPPWSKIQRKTASQCQPGIITHSEHSRPSHSHCSTVSARIGAPQYMQPKITAQTLPPKRTLRTSACKCASAVVT